MISLSCLHIPSYRNTLGDHDSDYGTCPYIVLLQGQPQLYHQSAQTDGDEQLQIPLRHLQV